QVARNSGAAWLAAVDVLEPRLAKAKAFGADLTVNAAQEDPVQAVLEATAGAGADRVIECIGTAKAIPSAEYPPQQAVRMARNGGRVVLMGLGGQQSPLLWKEVALKELSILGSRVTLGDFPRALDLMARGVFGPEGLVSGEFALEQTGEAFRLLEEDPEKYIKLLIRVES
ncbi:MAG: zinc-binding dehydrogenase, partial [Desulfarculaceae bacterium]